jgi:hypothetical protein
MSKITILVEIWLAIASLVFLSLAIAEYGKLKKLIPNEWPYSILRCIFSVRKLNNWIRMTRELTKTIKEPTLLYSDNMENGVYKDTYNNNKDITITTFELRGCLILSIIFIAGFVWVIL